MKLDKLRQLLFSSAITWLVGVIVLIPTIFQFDLDGITLTIGISGFIVLIIIEGMVMGKERSEKVNRNA